MYVVGTTYRVVQKTDTQIYFGDNFGNSAPILVTVRHTTSVAYSVELVLLNKHQISGGGAYPDCYPDVNHSFTVTSRNSWRVNVKFFHPTHLYCVTTLPSKTNTTANIGVKCFVLLTITAGTLVQQC